MVSKLVSISQPPLMSTTNITLNIAVNPIKDPSNPKEILVSWPLIGENYPTCTRLMKMALNAKNKLGLVDDTIKISLATEATLKQAWSKCNNTISSWILNSVSPQITASVIYQNTTFEVWKVLRKGFHKPME